MKPEVSICIPTYEMGGRGVEFLRHTLTTISLQTYKDIEICITDHSRDDKVQELCEEFRTFPSIRMNINYNRINSFRGSPSHNTNQSMLKANGKILKLLCQDDFLYGNTSIADTMKPFDNPDVNWVATSYLHTDGTYLFNQHIPKGNSNIHLENTLGTPSCIALRNKDLEMFDERLKFYYDCDWYKRMINRYGYPAIVNEPCMINYLWEGQVTNTIANEQLRTWELNYVKEKYKLQ